MSPLICSRFSEAAVMRSTWGDCCRALCLQKGVDKEKIAKSFPYGKVEVKVVGGGLRWHSGIIATGLGKRSFCDSPAFSP